MKRFILLLLLLFCVLSFSFNNQLLASDNNSEDLSSIEQVLFNQSFTSLPISERLNKIENILYGQTSDKNPIDARVKKIKAFVKSENIGSNNSPEANNGSLAPLNADNGQNSLPEKTFSKLEPQPNQYQQPSVPTPNIPENDVPSVNNYPPPPNSALSQDNSEEYNNANDTAQDKANYPIVDNLEASLFGQTFLNENIYKRLDRLETKIMGKKQSGSLYDRVNNLQIKAKYRVVQTPNNYQNNYNNQNNYIPQDNYNNQNNPSLQNNNVTIQPPKHQKGGKHSKKSGKSDAPILGIKDDQISSLEIAVFNKTYSGDLALNRLDRLEQKVFGQTTFGSIEERINKIAAGVHGSPYNSAGTPSKGYYFTEEGYSKDDDMRNSDEPRKQVMIGGSMGMQTDNSSSINAPSQPPDDDLSEAEMNFFGKSYQNLDTETRLNRLENAIWGNVIGGDIDARIVRVLQATKSINNGPGNPYAPQYGNNGNNYSGNSGGNSSTITSRNLYNGYDNNSGNYGYYPDTSTDNSSSSGSSFTITTPNYSNSNPYTNNNVSPNYGYNNTNPNYGYNNQNYGYNNTDPNYGYNNPNYSYNNPNYGNNNINPNYGYNNYVDPNQQYYNQPSRGIFSSVAGAALNSVLKNQNGILGNMGRAAGNAIMGIPYGNYGFGNSGYGNYGYGYPQMPLGIPY